MEFDNNSITIPRFHNFSNGDSSTARAGNRVRATHFGYGSRSRGHHSEVLAQEHYEDDTPDVPPRAGQSLPQIYPTHAPHDVEHGRTRTHGIPSHPSPTESHHSVDSNWSSSSSSAQSQQDLLQSYPSHSRPQYTPSVSRRSSYNEPRHPHYPAYNGSHGSQQMFPVAPIANDKSKHLLFEDAGPYLRETLHIPPYKETNLSAIPDPPEGEKPTQPYPILIKLAIYGSPNKQLTLQEIYTALKKRFQWFRDRPEDKAWKNSIRHVLSLNKVFKLVSRGITEPGKGGYWQLDCSDGEGYKRTRKRRRKSAQVLLEWGDDDDSSDGDMESMNFPSMSAGLSHIASSHPSRAASEESHIDPELRQGSHVVGEGRTRSRSRRTGVTGPYPIHGPPQQLPRYQQSPLPSYGNQYSAPRFGQSSFGQGSLGCPGLGQARARVLVPPAALSSAFVSSSSAMFSPVPVTSSRSQHTFVTQDRNAPIV